MRFWIAALLWAMSSAAAAQEEPGRKRLTVLFTTDLYGRFVEPGCEGPGRTSFAHLVGAMDEVRWELRAAGQGPPVVLNGGDNIGPGPFARSVLARGDDGGRRLAGWLARAGYELVALGNQDFFAAPERLRSYLRAGRAAGLVFGAANLDCSDPAQGVCPYLEPGADRPLWLERNGLRIAVFSVIHGDLAASVLAEQLEGVTVVDPVARAREVAGRARREGADVVIALAHLDHSETSPRHSLALARALPEADLVVASSFAGVGEGPGIGSIRFADGSTPVLGCDLFGQHLCRADLMLAHEQGRWRVTSLAPQELDVAEASPDEELQSELEWERELYCAEFEKPLGQGRLKAPMDAEGFLGYLLEIMRSETQSELSFSNRGLVNPRAGFPLEGALSGEVFYAALPHRNRLFTFELQGSELGALCRRLLEEERVLGRAELLSRGLKCGDSGAASVNDRPLDPAARYRAVTQEYLARGMLGYFQAQAGRMLLFQPDPAQDAPVLGELARAFLSGPRFQGARAEPIDPVLNFPDLARKLRWTLGGGVNLNLGDTTITNEPGYTESQLSRKAFLALKAELRGFVGASSSLHAFSLDALLRYARSHSDAEGWLESEDLVTVGLLYKLNALRDGLSAWYVPTPYLEAKLETELTRPEDDPATPAVEGRPYHHLELTATLGLRFPLLPALEAKLGFGLRDELLDEDRVPVYGLDLGYRLNRTSLFSLLDSPVQLESELSVFFGDIGRSNTLKGTLSNRLYFALVGPIFLNVSHDLFLYRYSTRGYGLASDLTVGLSYNARMAVQAF